MKPIDIVIILLIADILLNINNHFKLNTIMATLADFQAAFAEINETTNNIAADIEKLANGIASGMTDAEEAQALSELQGIAAKLKTIADTTPES